MALLSHQDLKLLSLVRSQDISNLLARITPYQLELRPDEFPQIVGVLLALGDDLLDLFALFFRQLQLVI